MDSFVTTYSPNVHYKNSEVGRIKTCTDLVNHTDPWPHIKSQILLSLIPFPKFPRYSLGKKMPTTVTLFLQIRTFSRDWGNTWLTLYDIERSCSLWFTYGWVAPTVKTCSFTKKITYTHISIATSKLRFPDISHFCHNFTVQWSILQQLNFTDLSSLPSREGICRIVRILCAGFYTGEALE